MANVLNRTTREYLPSVNTPEYPVEDWIINPDMSATIGFPSKYWVITGDEVTVMNQAQRDAVDAAEVAARRDSIVARLDQAEALERAELKATLDEFNLHAAKFNALFAAIAAASSLANLQTRVAALGDYPTRTLANLRTAIRNNLGS